MHLLPPEDRACGNSPAIRPSVAGPFKEPDMHWLNAPAHPRHPLQDSLYYVLHDYRVAKCCGLKSTAKHRRRALELIAQIKGRS